MSRVLFVQAEDGIRDGHVTGVQTCALPISTSAHYREPFGLLSSKKKADSLFGDNDLQTTLQVLCRPCGSGSFFSCQIIRSEERRVGKECRSQISRSQ